MVIEPALYAVFDFVTGLRHRGENTKQDCRLASRDANMPYLRHAPTPFLYFALGFAAASTAAAWKNDGGNLLPPAPEDKIAAPRTPRRDR
jgi:hypothetical protein